MEVEVRKELNVKDKIVCDSCKSIEFTENAIVTDLKPLPCTACERILISHFKGQHADFPGNIQDDEADDNLIDLPPKSKFFHLNADILYDNSRNENVYSGKSILVIGSDWIEHQNAFQSMESMKFALKVNLKRSKLFKNWMWANVFFEDFIEAEHQDINRKESTLSIVKEYTVRNQVHFDAILTIDEDCIQMASYLASELGCLGIPFEMTQKIQNKHEFRKYCDKIGIATPKYSLIASEKRLEHVTALEQFLKFGIEDEKLNNWVLSQFAKDVPLPFIIKNPMGCAKDFVRKCESIEQYVRAVSDSMKYPNMDLLVEEFFDGHELDIDILVQNDKAVFIGITDNLKPILPLFHETGSITPSLELCREETLAIRHIITDWIHRFGIQNALLHFEVLCRPISLYGNRKYDVNKPSEYIEDFIMPIEINLRMGGSAVWSLNNAAYGVNIFAEYVNIMLGLPLDVDALMRKQCSPRYTCLSMKYHLDQKRTKIDKCLVDMKKLSCSDEIVEFSLYKNVGDVCSDTYYYAWMMVKNQCNTSFEKLMQTLNDSKKLIKFKFT